jgi:hypothetical protein
MLPRLLEIVLGFIIDCTPVALKVCVCNDRKFDLRVLLEDELSEILRFLGSRIPEKATVSSVVPKIC